MLGVVCWVIWSVRIRVTVSFGVGIREIVGFSFEDDMLVRSVVNIS